jgi:YfiH family protein
MAFRTVEDLRFYVPDTFLRHVNVTNLCTTRHAGASPPPYASLNLGGRTGDDPANVRANRGRLSLLTSHGADALTFGQQVHGDRVQVVELGEAGRKFEATDALVTDLAEVPLVILVADCAAVTLYDPIHGAVGIAHAGWRGTAAGIAAKTVEKMMDVFDTDPTDLITGVGPSIGPCCYEVGQDVIDRFHAEQPLIANHVLTPAGSSPRPASDGEHMMLNLWRANVLQLVSAGVFEANVEVAGLCSSCHTEDFYSHRAESGSTGRSGAMIMMHERTKRSY